MDTAWLGLVGTLTGTALAYMGGLRAGRRTYNGERMAKTLEYISDVVYAVERQTLVMSLIADDQDAFVERAKQAVATGVEPDVFYLVPERLKVRLEASTESWRLALSKRVVWAQEPFLRAIVDYDSARAAAAGEFNAGGVKFRESLLELEARQTQVYLAIGVVVAEMNVRLAYDLSIGLDRRRNLKVLGPRLERARESYDEHMQRLSSAEQA